jgi:GT2 family glycosyltransferase
MLWGGMAPVTREGKRIAGSRSGGGLDEARAIVPAREARSKGWEAPVIAEVSVVIPTHDRAPFLAEVLAALERQTHRRFEVVVVDDASSEVTWRAVADAIGSSTLRVRGMQLASNAGPAVARNVGALAARSEVVAFLDDDCRPTPGWLAGVVEAMSGGADLVQGRTLPEPGALDRAGPWARTIWVTGTSWLFETCNIAYRRSSFLALGGFDPARPEVTRGSRPHFGEDAVLGWRLRAAGMRATFSHDALAYHKVYPGRYPDWLRELRRRTLFPALVRRSPGMRRALWGRLFLDKDTAAFDLALAGAVAAIAARSPLPLASWAPWAWSLLRRGRAARGRALPLRVAQYAVGDAVGFASLVAGSLSARSPVL